MLYAVTYDLNRPGKDYDDLYVSIRQLGDYWHELDSFWLVDSSASAKDIYDRLSPSLDKTDRIFVVRITDESCGYLDPDSWKWIRQHVS
jgi:hypothetical protein